MIPFLSAADRGRSAPVRGIDEAGSRGEDVYKRQYLDMYEEWCKPEVRETKRVAIAYVSAYGYTKELAEHIAAGAREEGVDVQVFDLSLIHIW